MDTLLTTVNRFTTSIRPLNYLLEQVIEKIVPHQKAQACGGYKCAVGCSGTCQWGHDVRLRSTHLYTSEPDCKGTQCKEFHCDNCEA